MLQVRKLVMNLHLRYVWISVSRDATVETIQGRMTIKLEIDTLIVNILVL